jgi:[ribosomal protein S5]-alanine N-acetyltransferase
MQIPTLHTERLALVPLSAACEGLYEEFYLDAEASARYGGPLTPGAAWARLSADVGSWHLRGFGVWAVQRRERQDLVGVCGYWQGKGWPRDLTWWLLPRAPHGIARALVLRLGGIKAGRRQFPDGLERDVFQMPLAQVSED